MISGCLQQPSNLTDDVDEITTEEEAEMIVERHCLHEYVVVRPTNMRTCPPPTSSPPVGLSWRDDLQVADLEVLERDPRRDPAQDLLQGQTHLSALFFPLCTEPSEACSEQALLSVVYELPPGGERFGCNWTNWVSPLPLFHHSNEEAVGLVTETDECRPPLTPTQTGDISIFTKRGPQEEEQPIGG
jgi:hypothetical protein